MNTTSLLNKMNTASLKVFLERDFYYVVFWKGLLARLKSVCELCLLQILVLPKGFPEMVVPT